MLEPEYFNDKADKMIEIYRQLEDFIMNDIANRLLKSQSVSGTADRMIWKLQQMGESRTEIMNKLSQITRLSKRELKALLQDAVMTSWDDDLSTFNKLGIEVVNPLKNAAVIAVMDAEYKKSLGELENLTRSTMLQANQDLIRMLDEVEIRIASGVQSYSSAVCEILDNYAEKGAVIEYPTGTKRTLEAAVRMCIVTSMNQTSAQITNQYIIEGGIEYVLVSAHLGARTQREGYPYLSGHVNWQGKVYKIRGSEEGFPNLLEMTGYDIREDGEGKVINPLGLHGYNCKHSHKPWDKDLKNPYIDENGNPKIDEEENKKRYELQQKQRAMEREIRKIKRKLLVKEQEINSIAETDVKEMMQTDYDRLSYDLKHQNEMYNEFCRKNDLQTQVERLKVAGFKRKQAAKASGRARAYENWSKKKREVEELTKEVSQAKTHDKKIDITDITINKVKKIQLSDYSDNELVMLQEKHKELLTLAKYNNNSNEVVNMFSTKFGKTITTYGNENSVLTSKNPEARVFMLGVKEKSVIWIHNHPKGSTFSYEDIAAFMQPQIKTFSVVTNQGKIYCLNKTSDFSLKRLYDRINILRNKYRGDANYQKLIMKDLLKEIEQFGVEYIR